jgi:nucleoside-diphosphate kinase
MSGKIEKTLIVFKPDALQRGVIGEIMTRFERVGLKLVAAKVVSPDKEFYFHHYENIGKMVSRRGQKTFDFTLEMMQRGPVLAMVLEGVEAVEVVRKLVGTTEPKRQLLGQSEVILHTSVFLMPTRMKKEFQT